MHRTSPGSVLFSTYNLLNLFAAGTAEAQQHYETIVAVIRALDTDVLAVQEILAPDPGTAAQRLRQLADDAGMRCEVPGADTAVAFGSHGYHVGLMWRDGIEAIPGSLRCYGGRDFWHGLALVTLDVGGTRIRHGAFHATPFGRGMRADQNERLVAAVTRPAGAGTGPTGGPGTCSGPAACTTPPRSLAPGGRPRLAITRTTSTARTGSGGASTPSA